MIIEHTIQIVDVNEREPNIGEYVCICLSDCTGWECVMWSTYFHKDKCDYWFSLDEINEQLP